jgi:hypothetical protein
MASFYLLYTTLRLHPLGLSLKQLKLILFGLFINLNLHPKVKSLPMLHCYGFLITLRLHTKAAAFYCSILYSFLTTLRLHLSLKNLLFIVS